ncbi:hypothetical protein Slin15195_G034080 [Septoria linicola]|uniref:NTF2-like domain-containing protein n=1 Tax=Septoria linicola TaxID=215465 RepID=A0A9Q9AIN2_9PEZI|nr:hypothetical protein Slin14017_G033110 [Septoria linicola]USW50089.1 hypothetical protein Slin15195_G034080 [Septoria linicola]
MHSPIFSLFAVSAFALGSVACNCLNDETAKHVADNFATTFSDFSEEFVNSTYSIDFTDQTDSVGWLISNGTDCPHPLGSLTLASRREFLDAQATQPNLPFEIENVWHDCTNVFTRWRFAIQPQQVQGIAVLGTVCNEGENKEQEPFLINHVFSEFNTGAFLVFQGDFVPTSSPACPANQKRSEGSGYLAAWTAFGHKLGLE